MPLILPKIPPKGIDKQIQHHQEAMFQRLCVAFNVSQDDYYCFGRAYKNQAQDAAGDIGYVPEVYHINGEYREVLFDDACSLNSFYGISDTSTRRGNFMVTEAHIIFHVNLDKLFAGLPEYDGNTHRMDGECRSIIFNELDSIKRGFEIKSIDTGIDKVFSEYTASQVKRGMFARDIFPLHCFRINCEIQWTN